MFDTHMHTCFSADSQMQMEEAVKKAWQDGFGIIITEHMDIDYPGKAGAFEFDIAEYFKAYHMYRSEAVLLGIEVGMQQSVHSKNAAMVAHYPFDYVIGSIHIVEHIDIYQTSYYTSQTKKQAYERYLETMLDCILHYQDFDSLGHIDYIARYAQYEDPELWLADYAELFDEIMNALIRNNKVMEINTRRLDDPCAVKALAELYKRYKQLGGKFVTIGSDAHRPGEIGRRVEAGWEFAESIGLMPVYFKERKMLVDNKQLIVL